MEDSGLARAVAFSVAGYPLYIARTLIQIGYEPKPPGPDGRLPNIFSYINIIKQQRGYLALYTGIGHHISAVVLKKSAYDLMASLTDHKKEVDRCDSTELISTCICESFLVINSSIITYPLVTLGVNYISSVFFGAEDIKFTIENLYKGIIPKIIFEVTMVWVSIIGRKITVSLIEDDLGQAVISRVPSFIANSLLYPLNVVSTVMSDHGRSGLNPKFDNWQSCFNYLKSINQLNRGSPMFFRRAYKTIAGNYVKVYY